MCDCSRRGWVPGQKQTQRGGRGVSSTGFSATTVWGPIVWRALHDLAEVAGDNELWEELGRVLPGALPCVECQGHMTAWIAANPLGAMEPRKWMLAAHNAVNRRMGHRVWSIEELAAVYQGCDRLMLTLELRDMVRELGEVGILGVAAVRVMERMVE